MMIIIDFRDASEAWSSRLNMHVFDGSMALAQPPMLGSPNPRNEWITPEVAEVRSSANFGGWFV